jgi:hypothetical protein
MFSAARNSWGGVAPTLGLDGDLKPGRKWRMEVTDEFANPIYVIHIDAEKK